MRIKKLPLILALHLKRFKMDSMCRYTKLSYRVVFPFELRLFNTSDDATNAERLYDLIAVVVHCGRYDYLFSLLQKCSIAVSFHFAYFYHIMQSLYTKLIKKAHAVVALTNMLQTFSRTYLQ